jgi:HicB family
MDLRPYAEDIRRQLLVAADASGDDARALAERLSAPLDAAVRLALQDVLAAAAEEITVELAPGSVELRLRGRDPEFVVNPPPVGQSLANADEDSDSDEAVTPAWPTHGFASSASAEGDEPTMARINLRMPDHLKMRVEQAAAAEGLSLNAWLVRAAAAALGQTGRGRRAERRAPQGGQHYVGWGR